MHTKPTDAQLENRFMHHPPVGDQAKRFEQIRTACCDLAKLIRDLTPCCPEQSLAINAVDQAMMWANAAIARNGDSTSWKKAV